MEQRTRAVWNQMIRLTSKRTGHAFTEEDELGLGDLLAACEYSADISGFFATILQSTRPEQSPARKSPGQPGGEGRPRKPGPPPQKKRAGLAQSQSAPALPAIDGARRTRMLTGDSPKRTGRPKGGRQRPAFR